MDYLQTGNQSSELHRGPFDRSSRAPETAPGKRTLTSSLASNGKPPRTSSPGVAKDEHAVEREGAGGGEVEDPFALHLLGSRAEGERDGGDDEEGPQEDGSVVYGGKVGMPRGDEAEGGGGGDGGAEAEAPSAAAEEESAEGEEGEEEDEEDGGQRERGSGRGDGLAAASEVGANADPGEVREDARGVQVAQVAPAAAAHGASDARAAKRGGQAQLRAEGKAAPRANAARRSSRTHSYAVHLKAWIPHDHVVDPEGASAGKIADILQSVANPFPFGPRIKVKSRFRGDKHTGFPGGYRVKSKLQLRVKEGKIVSATHEGGAGASHRDVDWEVYVKGPFGFKKTLKRGRFTETRTARGNWSGSGSGTSFRLKIDSKNPLVKTTAPAISSDLAGTTSKRGLRINYLTDQFPSHGVAVYKNGKALTTRVVRDAAQVEANGIRGAVNVGAGLVSQTVRGQLATK